MSDSEALRVDAKGECATEAGGVQGSRVPRGAPAGSMFVHGGDDERGDLDQGPLRLERYLGFSRRAPRELQARREYVPALAGLLQ